MTDLQGEVNKARFYQEHQYGLHWILSSIQAESLYGEDTVSPAIPLHGEPPDLVNPAHSDVPQFIYNHHCRDSIRYRGECNACN